ncbi:MAG: type II toxin-antitoxin system HigB family toxin [Thermodesulfobacteriota bacterium]
MNLKVLDDFCVSHADVRNQIEAWKNEVEDACWASPTDIQARYSSASIIGGKKVIFNIKGNSYRLYVKVDYETQVVFIKEIGTHAEYNTWDI